MPQPHDSRSPDLWDLVVRLSHWVIAAVVVDNALLIKGGSALHLWLGWIGMVFLIVRLIRGLVGSAKERFTAFPLQPRAALGHIRHLLAGAVRENPSYTPTGAMMICALWATLAMVIGTGLVLTKAAPPWEIGRQQAAVAAGDWSALALRANTGRSSDAAGAGVQVVGTIHQFGGHLLLLLAVLHLGGVAAESVALRRNLLRPMVSGKRR